MHARLLHATTAACQQMFHHMLTEHNCGCCFVHRIAIVDETYGQVKESEGDQILRNKALIIDEIESTLTDACIDDLNSRYAHTLCYCLL